MKKDNKKIKEPYEPHRTPQPPQIIEPNGGRERQNPMQEHDRKDEGAKNAAGENPEKPHLLADESDIDDETTI